MAATISLNPNRLNWQYLIGMSGTTRKGRHTFCRYYFAHTPVFNVRVEKCETPNKTTYSIGNYDKAKKKYKTEEELLKALGPFWPAIRDCVGEKEKI